MYIGVDLDGKKFYIRKCNYNDFLDMLKIKMFVKLVIIVIFLIG